MRANRDFGVSACSFAAFSRFLLVAGGPVRLAAAGLAGGAVLSLGGCAQPPMQRLASGNSNEYFPSSIYGAASPRVVADGEPVPRGGGMYMIGKPYSIAGQTYYPSEKHYAAIGLASWYGDAFHGRRTANGEVYDRDSISAAHPTMPLPSYARVTNLRNNYSMIVRVNDRGPFASNRIMDVSRKTAEVLDFRQRGTTRVKVEYIGAASLAGSNDQMLLATLRTDGPASLDGGKGRDRSLLAENAAPPIAGADPQPITLAARDAAAEAESAPAGRASGRQIPLPPARPLDLGTIPGAGVPIALR
ncbi:MAG: RlpA-like protein [Beijerinckiaceae bacterium]|nr:MAG: RlpA-like protein [Beijerinckiaceae bacterium]